MALRSLAPVLLLVLGVLPVSAQDLGRADRLRAEFLSETVRRGLPLSGLATEGTVPYWPRLDQVWSDAASLEPQADVDLVGAWMDQLTGRSDLAASALQSRWPRPTPQRFSVRQWGTTLFASWAPASDSRAWIQAWLGWEGKAYSPESLVRGLEVLESADPSAVEPLLKQALALYPEDRRYLELVARHPSVVRDPVGLLARDRAANGGLGLPVLTALLQRSPSVRDLLVQAGYTDSQIQASLARDYGSWLAQPKSGTPGAVPADGVWNWDADRDGRAESQVVVRGGLLTSWTRTSDQGTVWTLTFSGNQPLSLRESRGGTQWLLKWEAYPWVRTLEYRAGQTRLVYRFAPLAQSVPLWPSERFRASAGSLPAALAEPWLPLDPRSLALAASSIETWNGDRKTSTVGLVDGQVWLLVEDTNQDGRDDTWTYFRSGQIASVYRDLEGQGQANLRELYQKGQLVQVQSRSPAAAGPEFVLFPKEGVQLWDPHGDRRPLERLFQWSGDEQVKALVFSGAELPWATMPLWESRP